MQLVRLLVLLLLWSLPRWLVKRQPGNRGVFIVDILMCTFIFYESTLFWLPCGVAVVVVVASLAGQKKTENSGRFYC